ncbi:hypothetical protein N7454_004238 [Penicillium verhagenii]|nr:hypothetical protein N7454_004238 [Penicillium verhagenii]
MTGAHDILTQLAPRFSVDIIIESSREVDCLPVDWVQLGDVGPAQRDRTETKLSGPGYTDVPLFSKQVSDFLRHILGHEAVVLLLDIVWSPLAP